MPAPPTALAWLLETPSVLWMRDSPGNGFLPHYVHAESGLQYSAPDVLPCFVWAQAGFVPSCASGVGLSCILPPTQLNCPARLAPVAGEDWPALPIRSLARYLLKGPLAVSRAPSQIILRSAACPLGSIDVIPLRSITILPRHACLAALHADSSSDTPAAPSTPSTTTLSPLRPSTTVTLSIFHLPF